MTALEGGITNRNYLVQAGDRRFVARICEELLHLGIDRRNESECQRFAATLGIAPAIAYQEVGVTVSHFVTGKTFSTEDLQDEVMLARVAKTLRQLHDSADQLEGMMLFFSPFQTVLTYAATARRLKAVLPPEIDDLLEDSKELARRMSPFTPALCHNDLLPANFIDDGERLWLVDWEYAGVGNPLFDLASVSANCSLNDRLEAGLLEQYRGRLEERDQAELKILKTISLLRESLWSVIQTVVSDIAFDYHKYAHDNLEAYRLARGAIE